MPGTPPRPPKITVTPRALAQLRAAAQDAGGDPLRLEVTPRFEHELYFAPREPGLVEVEVDADGFAIALDAESAARADGVAIDYVDAPGGGAGFAIDNPNGPARVAQLTPRELAAWLAAGRRIEVFDVRTDREREVAQVAGTRHLDAQGAEDLLALDRDTPVAFLCHHGVRSQAAAERAIREGFRRVYNVSGGIDAWSLTVDPRVPRY